MSVHDRLYVKHNGRWFPVGKLVQVARGPFSDPRETHVFLVYGDSEDDGQHYLWKASDSGRPKRLRLVSGGVKSEMRVAVRRFVTTPHRGWKEIEFFVRPSPLVYTMNFTHLYGELRSYDPDKAFTVHFPRSWVNARLVREQLAREGVRLTDLVSYGASSIMWTTEDRTGV